MDAAPHPARPQLVRAEALVADPALGEAGLLRDAALRIEGGRVAAVGPWRELAADAEGLEPLLPPDDLLVVPGLVDAHHHGRFFDTRDAGMEDAPLELWLPRFARYPGVDPYLETFAAALRRLRAGVTTSLQAHSAGGPWRAFEASVRRALDAYRDAGVRVAFALGHFDRGFLGPAGDDATLARLPADLRGEVAAAYLPSYVDSDAVFELIDALAAELPARWPRARLLLSPIGPHWASDALLERIAETATRLGLGVHMHFLETQPQRRYAEARFGPEPARALAGRGLLDARASLAHAVWATPADFAAVAAAGATVVTNPASNLRLGSGRFPWRAARAAGARVALGGDSLALDGDDDPWRALALLQTVHRGPDPDASPDPYAALTAATVGGAHAAGLAGEVGRLLPGYAADLVAVDLARVRARDLEPADLPRIVARALGEGRAADVRAVLLGGEVRARDGDLVGHDLATTERDLVAAARAAVGERTTLPERLEPHLRRLYGADRAPPAAPTADTKGTA